MGSTIPKKGELGCIAKEAEHEAENEPMSSIFSWSLLVLLD